MATTFQHSLQKYAELTVHVGLNLRAGQRLTVRGASFENQALVHAIAEAAYKAGARLVEVSWMDDQMELIRFAHAPRDSFDEFPKWRLAGALEYAERGDATLSISGADPELLARQDPELVGVYHSTMWKEMAPYLNHVTGNSMNWCVIAAARQAWAKKVFPNMQPEKAAAKLWKTIFQMCRVNTEDPVAAWQEHIRNLQARGKYLSQKQYAALRYTAPGTDLTLGLPPGHCWASARELAKNGVEFTANIPTEETFTMGDRNRADGIVSSTKTLNHGGVLIEGIVVRFENGRVVEARASRNEAALQKIIATDDGAACIGEIALVPNSSPISKSGLVFHNTLFDENASCHLALGRAYKFNYSGGLELNDEEFAAVGGNQSLIHVDFMIGSGAMDIDGLTRDGRAEPVMRQGEWAFTT